MFHPCSIEAQFTSVPADTLDPGRRPWVRVASSKPEPPSPASKNMSAMRGDLAKQMGLVVTLLNAMARHPPSPHDADRALKSIPVDWDLHDLRRIWGLWKLIPVGQLPNTIDVAPRPALKRGRPKGSGAYHSDLLLMPEIQRRVSAQGEPLSSVCRSLAQNVAGQSVESTSKRLQRKYREWRSGETLGQ